MDRAAVCRGPGGWRYTKGSARVLIFGPVLDVVDDTARHAFCRGKVYCHQDSSRHLDGLSRRSPPVHGMCTGCQVGVH